MSACKRHARARVRLELRGHHVRARACTSGLTAMGDAQQHRNARSGQEWSASFAVQGGARGRGRGQGVPLPKWMAVLSAVSKTMSSVASRSHEAKGGERRQQRSRCGVIKKENKHTL